MILVDTSVWIDHFRVGDAVLVARLEQAEVLVHPFITGEQALGNMKRGDEILEALSGMPALPVEADGHVLAFIRSHALQGSGIGYVDAHLLSSVQANAGARLWTRDKRLRSVADRLDLAVNDP